MNDASVDLASSWTGWLWACGLASCAWPLKHPAGKKAGAALAARRLHLSRAARAVAGAAGQGIATAVELNRAAADLIESGPWGDDDEQFRTLSETSALRPGDPFADDTDRLHRALLGTLEHLCAEVFRQRALSFQDHPERAARTPIGRLQIVGVVGGWIARPTWRSATGADAVRRALKRVVDDPTMLAHLDEGGAAAGLERCVVEVHNWLQTGELGQPWMSDWTAS
jgi:hypothetical protein